MTLSNSGGVVRLVRGPVSEREPAVGRPVAGVHLIIDMWDAHGLDDPDLVADSLRAAVAACGATLLDIAVHEFVPSGLTALAMLAESHISMHTWPERGFAAVDVFTCGTSDPRRAVPVLERAFAPGHLEVTELRRGRTPASATGQAESGQT